MTALEEFHRENPVRLGPKRPELREKAGRGLSVPLFHTVVGELVSEGELVEEQGKLRLKGHEIRLKEDEQKLFDRVAEEFEDGGFTPPGIDGVLQGAKDRTAGKVKTALLETGTLVDLGESVLMHRDAVAKARGLVEEMFRSQPELSASEIRQKLNTTRRYLIPLLNHFDSTGLTQRRGDKRVLRTPVHKAEEDPKQE